MEIDKQSKIKILLVDDREENLFSLETIFEKDGYELVKATSGREALKILLKEVNFTLILMDVQMPDINGFETAKMIYDREKLRHIPIIFVTAQDYSEEFIFKGYKAGAVDYIYKPINPQLLRTKVSVLVDLYRKNHLLLAHERKLQLLNSELEERVKERTEELSQKNTELERINSELKKVNNDLDSFVYAASHDLKAPISNIEGLLTALYECLKGSIESDENAKSIFEMLNQSLSRFKGTLLDLTEITKIQKNLDEDITHVDLVEVLTNVLHTLNDLINSSNARVYIDSDESVLLNFSRKNLTSILLNLISNAIKYKSPERDPVIRITVAKKQDIVKLVIADNGLGFDWRDKNKIFGMFKRLHSHVDGTGVGLYLVKRILENTGGSIDAESVLGKGSVFRVVFKNSLKPSESVSV